MRSTLTLLIALLAFTPAVAKQPNVVFILADDLGWSDTTLYGHTSFYRTPHIERLAERGMTFTRAYAASPLCSPTRASILTGLSPARTGITSPGCHLPQVSLEATVGATASPGKKAVPPKPPTRLKTEHYTLAEALRDAGYATGHFGKWHLGRDPYSPLQHGFDVDVPHWPGPGPAGSFVAPWKFPDFDPDTPNQHIEDRMAKEAVAFIEKHQHEPFFLNYWMFSVHAPFDAKPDLIEKYRQSVDPKDPQRSPTYAAMIESMDDAVGTLLDTLERLKLIDNTLIIFFSDNGGNMYNQIDGTTPTSNAPLRGGKATMFEGGIRVPCIVSWPPRIKANTRSDAVVQSNDFFPAIAELLDLGAIDTTGFDGISFAPALEGKPLKRDSIFTYFPHDPPVPDWIPPSVAIHRGDWKLIRLFYQGEKGAHRWKLFNLSEDPGEKADVAAAHPELVETLDQEIEQFLDDTSAILPVRNPKFDPKAYRPDQEGKGKIRSKPKPVAEKVDPKLKGWKARHCKAEVRGGVVTITGTPDKKAFLGVGAGVSGPAKVKLKLRTTAGGAAGIEWIQRGTKPERIDFDIPASAEWQTKEVEIPATGALGIVRVYVPATPKRKVEIDSIQLVPKEGKPRRWEF